MSTARVIREIFTDVSLLIDFKIACILLRHLEFPYCLQVSVQVSKDPDFWQVVLSFSEHFNSFSKELLVFKHPEE